MPAVRRQQMKAFAILGCVVLTILVFFFRIFSSSSASLNGLSETFVPNGPQVVIVTVLDTENYSEQYMRRIKQNREDYAARHGTWRIGFVFVSIADHRSTHQATPTSLLAPTNMPNMSATTRAAGPAYRLSVMR